MSAPGAKCPDCILAARRERDAVKVAAAPIAGLAKSGDEAQARDRAILDLLQFGPASFERLMNVMPGTFETSDARQSACRMAVIRMKAKGLVKVVPEGYARA